MVLLVGDFLVEPEETERALRAISAEGAVGEIVMVVDPIEETYPFSGNTRVSPPGRLVAAVTPRAQNLRDAYLAPACRASRSTRTICARLGLGT